MEGTARERLDPRQYRARGRATVELDQGRVLAAAEDVPLLRSLGLDTLEGALAFTGGTVVRTAGPRVTRRIETGSGVMYLKAHTGLAPAWKRFTFLGRGATSPARGRGACTGCCRWRRRSPSG